MQNSLEINDLCAALALAQAKFKPAVKNKTNPHFRSKYADLDSIMDEARGPLAENGLSLIQPASMTPERLVRITTRLMHKSGQWIEDYLDLRPDKDTPQAIGSTITYGRRYGSSAMLGITSDEDDDGNAAQGSYSEPTKAQYVQLEAEHKAKVEAAKRKLAFAQKAEELGVDKAFWADIANRMKDTGRNIPDMQQVVDELEHERATTKEVQQLKGTF